MHKEKVQRKWIKQSKVKQETELLEKKPEGADSTTTLNKEESLEHNFGSSFYFKNIKHYPFIRAKKIEAWDWNFFVI